LDELRARVERDGIADADALVGALKDELVSPGSSGDTTLHSAPDVTNVWLFVGVNGVGKTTTIGKLGHARGPRRPPRGHGCGRHVPGGRG
jgi:fused signal recognition particle receptor